MSKIAFFCIPAHGHTNPTLPVVRELVARGHQVWYYSYQPLRDKIEATGARFIPCDDYDLQMKISPEDARRLVTDIAYATQVIVETTLAMDEDIIGQMRQWQPDCIVGDSMAFWGKLVARKLGVPFVSSTTTFAFNRYSAKVLQPHSGGLLGTLLSMARANGVAKKLRQHGYPVKGVLSIIANDNDTDTIVYTSPAFQPFAETFSSRYAFVGPSVPPVEGPLEKPAPPLVYISLGTVLNDYPAFYQNCVTALGGGPWEVIMSVGEGFDTARLGDLPPNFQVEQRVDQLQVLRQASAFITHCGMNSVSEGLYYEVPLALFPQTTEQRGVADRVRALGAGCSLPGDSPGEIKAVVQELLQNPSYRTQAQAIAAGFRQCGGATQAAEKILSVIGQ